MTMNLPVVTVETRQNSLNPTPLLYISTSYLTHKLYVEESVCGGGGGGQYNKPQAPLHSYGAARDECNVGAITSPGLLQSL